MVPDLPAGSPPAADVTLASSNKSVSRAPVQSLKASRTEPTLEALIASSRLEAPRHPLDEQVEVVGETFHVKGIKRVFEQLGMPVTSRGCTIEDVECILAPEPWNPHDPNAVAVMIGTHPVGYLPAELAVDYASGLGQLAVSGILATGVARIWAKSDAGMVRARVTILIPEAQRF